MRIGRKPGLAPPRPESWMSVLPLSYLAFVSMALPDGLLGVAWPSMRLSLGEPVGALGLLLPFGVVSSLLSSASTGVILTRTGVGRVLGVSAALSAVALVGCGLAPAFWAVILAAVLLAAGSGAIDSGMNAYAARHFTARHINWMHASYGLGALGGPLLVTGVIGAGLSWRWAYACVGAVQALLATAFFATSGRWLIGATSGDTRVARPARGIRPSLWHAFRLAALWRGAAVFALETGLESTTALWAFLFLTEGRGLVRGVAAATVSAYWGTLCAGRLILGPLAERCGAHRVLVAGVAGIVLGAVLVAVPAPDAVAVAGIVVTALGAAPMVPLLTLTTGERVGGTHADQTVGVQVAASALGAAVIPAVVGVLLGRYGAGTLGPCLVVLAGATTAAYAVTAGAGRRSRCEHDAQGRSGLEKRDPPAGS
jgi:fucose permease